MSVNKSSKTCSPWKERRISRLPSDCFYEVDITSAEGTTGATLAFCDVMVCKIPQKALVILRSCKQKWLDLKSIPPISVRQWHSCSVTRNSCVSLVVVCLNIGCRSRFALTSIILYPFRLRCYGFRLRLGTNFKRIVLYFSWFLQAHVLSCSQMLKGYSPTLYIVHIRA